MEIVPVDPDDAVAVEGYVHVWNASTAHDAPWVPPRTVRGTRGALRWGWDGEPFVSVLGLEDGVPVACGGYKAGERDNLHLAWLGVDVHPDHRRRGLGSALLRHLEQMVAGLGRTTVGIDTWDDGRGGETFAVGHGYARASVAVNRGQHLPDLDPALVEEVLAEAAAAAGDYELVRTPHRTPDHELEAFAAMAAAINDAPTDDLDLEDEVIDGARVRAYEEAHERRGIRLYRLVVRHRGSGELAGQTLVAVDPEQAWIGHQHDTSVVRAHRGHRLGALLKAGMLRWLREEQPQLTWIHTWNAESNDHMIGVNERLGYQVLGREVQLQRVLARTDPAQTT